MIFDWLRRNPRRAEVTLPLAEWHATTLAIDGLVDHNDELQALVDALTIEVAEHRGTIARLANERDRARSWAVHLEQENAELEDVNADLAGKVTAHHSLGACQGCAREGVGLEATADSDDVRGVPA